MLLLISATAQSENYINVYFHFPLWQIHSTMADLFSMQIADESN